jgi:hypothetical protein
MDHTAFRPLSFKSIKGRFRLIEVNYVSYTDGSGFFAVSRPDTPQPFPFSPSMRCHVAKHDDDEIIPLPVITNWMSRLALTTQEIGTFWAVEDLGDYPTQINLPL